MDCLTKEGLINALIMLGLEKGDTVMIHSDITSFGITNNFSKNDLLKLYYDAFINVIGLEGTLCVPAYFYEYARNGIPFDIALSPISKEIGVFSKYINSLPTRKRSCNPLTSVCAIGKNADYICENVNRHAYGENSAFDRLYKLNVKIISLGTIAPFTIGHLAEFQVGVPYLYNKIYNIPILNNGKIIFENSIGYVKYLDYNIHYSEQIDTTVHKRSWYNEKFVSKLLYLNTEIIMVKAQDFIAFIKEALYKNPYACLLEPPAFILGKVPNDGPVMKK